MKKCFFVLFTFVLLLGCEDENDVRSDLQILKDKREVLTHEVKTLAADIKSKAESIEDLEEKLRELKIYESGNSPVYILKIHLKQSHFSLDLGKHLKDAMNSMEFEIPVSKDFYHAVEQGTRIVDEFRVGSFLLHGSIGDWRMTVKNKYIRQPGEE